PLLCCASIFCSGRPRAVLLSVPVPARTCASSLSLHDALPIFLRRASPRYRSLAGHQPEDLRCVAHHLLDTVSSTRPPRESHPRLDRKSTRLNSSHVSISYAVFCLKKKIKQGVLDLTTSVAQHR